MDPLIRAIVSIGILVFLAKLIAGTFRAMKLPPVLGELMAGVIFGPYALGSGISVYGQPLVVVNEYVKAFAEIGVIMLLFAAGIEMGLTSLRKAGPMAPLIALGGGTLPFFTAYYIYRALGRDVSVAMVGAAAFVATSVAITARVLDEFDLLNTDMGLLVLNSAVIGDIVGVIVLGIIYGAVAGGAALSLPVVAQRVVMFILLWLVILAVAVVVLPVLLEEASRLRIEGAAEAAAVSAGFIMSAITAALGLSPIVGAYAAGLAIGESRVIERVKDFINHLEMMFGPLFFTYIGTQLNPRLFLDPRVVGMVLFLTALAMITKIVGSAIPAMLKLPPDEALALGIGMTPRGELGLIVASLGLTAKVLDEVTYAELVGMSALTTFLAPLLLMRFCVRMRESFEVTGTSAPMT